MIYSINKFRHYLLGQKCTFHVDHLKEEASNRMVELKAEAEQMVHEQKEAMGRLQEQATGKEAELKRKLAAYAATMAEKENEVLDLQAALDYAKEWNRREEERNRQREEKMVAYDF